MMEMAILTIDMAGILIDNNNNTTDTEGHGAHVAGIIGAETNNGLFIAGVSWNAKILPVKAITETTGSVSIIAQAIKYAVDRGAKIINLSLGGTEYSELEHEAINYALRKRCVVVAATGNDSAPEAQYPAVLPGVIGVGASDDGDALGWFSNYGKGLDVVAPGVDVVSTYIEPPLRIPSATYSTGPSNHANQDI